MNKSKLFSLLIATSFFSSASASYYGRITSGGFISKEVFRDSDTERYNDVSIFSQRLYVSFDKLADTNTDAFIDLRDKHDFFDKLNTETLRLTPSNKFQIYQASLRDGGDSVGFKFQAGRFPLNEAGSVFVDGADIGYRQILSGYLNKISFFGGFNPSDIGQYELTFNSKAKVFGVYDILENKSKDWERYFYMANSLVRQMYQSDVDRTYLFNNTIIQSGNDSNFTSLLYLDIQPRPNVQNLWTSYVFAVNRYRLRASLSSIDTIHYKRVQDIREELPASRYHQASFSIRNPSVLDHASHEFKLTAGKRIIDGKTLLEAKWGVNVPRIFDENLSANFDAGVRKNFTSQDIFGGFGMIHSNKFREISLNQDVILEKRQDIKNNLALVTDASYTKFFNRSLFGIASVQNTWDSKVSILSLLFKISYRFGEGGQAPIRDGSPPMGQL